MHGDLVLLLLSLLDLHLQQDLLVSLLLLLEQENLLLLGVARVQKEVVRLDHACHHGIGHLHVLLLHHSGRLVLDRVLRSSGVAGPVIPLQAAYVVPVPLHEIITIHVDVDLQRTLALVVYWSLYRYVIVCPGVFLPSGVFDSSRTVALLGILVAFVAHAYAFIVVLPVSQLVMRPHARAPIFLELPVSVVCG